MNSAAWHTFWNAGDAPDPEVFGEFCGRYALDMRPESLPGLCTRFGVWFPGVE